MNTAAPLPTAEFDRDAFTVAEREWTPRPLVPERAEPEMPARARDWFATQFGGVAVKGERTCMKCGGRCRWLLCDGCYEKTLHCDEPIAVNRDAFAQARQEAFNAEGR
jgi:hypothetical protein